jgi:ABC-type Mn2+/Zn2+ transport system ATPase subunit
VLLRNPKLLILDEPFANVSPRERGRILDAILGIPRSVTVCVISREHELIADFDKIIEVQGNGDGGHTTVVKLPETAIESGSERRADLIHLVSCVRCREGDTDESPRQSGLQ